jgi:purine-nucleoside phosphorylase
MIYEYILNGNKKFGTNPIDIVRSRLCSDPEIIQKNVIIAPSWEPDIFTDYVESITQIFDSTFKVSNLLLNDRKITYILTGTNAPRILEVVLALGCTPCEKIIFIGSAGGLDKNLKIGDIVIPEYSICGDGACRYLTNKKISENDCFGDKYYPNNKFYEKIKSITDRISKENNINWYIGKNFSIDTVLGQFAHIDEIINMGCNCIEMETAALFKVAEICKIEACAIFCISDNTIIKKSLLSGRIQEEMDYMKFIRRNVVTKIVLECCE